jgi:hypothetical protein
MSLARYSECSMDPADHCHEERDCSLGCEVCDSQDCVDRVEEDA